MKELVRRHPALCFSVFIVLWTWIFMAVVIAFVPIDPVEGPQFVHVALVFFVASSSVFGFVFARMVDGKEGVRALVVRVGRWRVGPSMVCSLPATDSGRHWRERLDPWPARRGSCGT